MNKQDLIQSLIDHIKISNSPAEQQAYTVALSMARALDDVDRQLMRTRISAQILSGMLSRRAIDDSEIIRVE